MISKTSLCFLSIVLFLPFIINAQADGLPDAGTVLDKAIAYHDPGGVWGRFNGTFTVVMQSPGEADRISNIQLNQPGSYFLLEVSRGESRKSYELKKDSCSLTYKGSTEFSAAVAEKERLSCDRARMYRNYYSYLYGLPMKLKDPGTQLDAQVKRRTFKGKEYLVLKATYRQDVGKDTWYFYFNPKTYAMQAYQFFHDESKNDGEFILLSGEENIQGIRMPKTREWYTNKEEKLLGTDILMPPSK